MSLLWSHSSSNSPRGLALARESGCLFLWDNNSSLAHFDSSGQRVNVRSFPFSIAGVACADDGSGCAVFGSGGELCSLAGDLTTRWEKHLTQGLVGLALDSFGQRLAAADAKCRLWVFDSAGAPRWQAEAPRPLAWLAFVPERPLLIASADFGLVACFDDAGRWLWRDGLVANVGSLAVDGSGKNLVLACFSDGLCRYNGSGDRARPEAKPLACRFAALSYDGSTVLAIGLEGHVLLQRRGKSTRIVDIGRGAAASVALAPLGDRAYIAKADGTLLGLDLSLLK